MTEAKKTKLSVTVTTPKPPKVTANSAEAQQAIDDLWASHRKWQSDWQDEVELSDISYARWMKWWCYIISAFYAVVLIGSLFSPYTVSTVVSAFVGGLSFVTFILLGIVWTRTLNDRKAKHTKRKEEQK